MPVLEEALLPLSALRANLNEARINLHKAKELYRTKLYVYARIVEMDEKLVNLQSVLTDAENYDLMPTKKR